MEGAGLTFLIFAIIALVALVWYESGKQTVYEDCMNFGAFEYKGEVINCERNL